LANIAHINYDECTLESESIFGCDVICRIDNEFLTVTGNQIRCILSVNRWKMLTSLLLLRITSDLQIAPFKMTLCNRQVTHLFICDFFSTVTVEVTVTDVVYLYCASTK